MNGPSTPHQSIRYVVDQNDRVVEISPSWDDFARESAAPGLESGNVLNRSLWEFLSGAETLTLYRILVDRVRHTGRTIALPFRCDGPEVRRFMQLEISPAEHGRVAFVTRTVAEENRPAVALLEAAAVRSENLVTMCGWCKKVKAGPQLWMETEEAVRTLELLRDPQLPRLSHGICESCRGNVIQSLRPPTQQVVRPGSTLKYDREQPPYPAARPSADEGHRTSSTPPSPTLPRMMPRGE